MRDTLRFSEDHLWAEDRDGVIRLGMTDYAQSELGEIAYIELAPVGTEVAAGDTFGSIDSLKSSSDLYAPFPCTISAHNPEVLGSDSSDADPTLINRDPSGRGWVVEVRAQTTALETLMDEEAYTEFTGG